MTRMKKKICKKEWKTSSGQVILKEGESYWLDMYSVQKDSLGKEFTHAYADEQRKDFIAIVKLENFE